MNAEIVFAEIGTEINVKIESALWCNPSSIIYDSLGSVQAMFSSCLFRKSVSHNLEADLCFLCKWETCETYLLWKGNSKQSLNHKNNTTVYCEPNTLERVLDRSAIITARTGLEEKGNIWPAQAFGQVGELCNGSTDPQACLLPAGQQTQRGRSPQCISETKDPSHWRLFPATLRCRRLIISKSNQQGPGRKQNRSATANQ